MTFWEDPYPLYREIRDRGAAIWDDAAGAWLITGYHAARQALADDALSSAWLGEDSGDEVMAHVLQWFMWTDGPAHRQLRRSVASLFSEATVRARADEVDRCVARHWRDAPRPDFDGLADFAVPVVTELVTSFAALPPSAAPAMVAWSEAAARLMAQAHRPAVRHGAAQAWANLMAAVADTHHPPAVASLLAFAGISTTSEAVARSLALAVDHGSAVRARSPESVAAEVLRYDTPVPQVPRIATRPTTVDGAEIGPGDQVLIILAAANHDTDVWPGAGSFCPVEAPTHGIPFGHGRHRCVGAALAEAILRAVVRHVRSAAPVRRGPTQWHSNRGYRGIAALPLTWPAAPDRE